MERYWSATRPVPAALAFRRHCFGIDCSSDIDELITDESLVVCTQQASHMMILIYVALCMFRELERENRKSGRSQPKDLILQLPTAECHLFCQLLLGMPPVFPSQVWPDSHVPLVLLCFMSSVAILLQGRREGRFPLPTCFCEYAESWENQVFGNTHHFAKETWNTHYIRYYLSMRSSHQSFNRIQYVVNLLPLQRSFTF